MPAPIIGESFLPRPDNKLGRAGEDYAVEMITQNGFKVIERNIHTKYGEIDIIAKKNGVWHFIEVRARQSDRFGSAGDSITERKKMAIVDTVDTYRQEKMSTEDKYQIDLIALTWKNDQWQMEFLENFIEDI